MNGKVTHHTVIMDAKQVWIHCERQVHGQSREHGSQLLEPTTGETALFDSVAVET